MWTIGIIVLEIFCQILMDKYTPMESAWTEKKIPENESRDIKQPRSQENTEQPVQLLLVSRAKCIE